MPIGQALKVFPTALGTVQTPLVVLNRVPITFSGGSLTALTSPCLLAGKPTTSASMSTGLRLVAGPMSLANRRQLYFAHQHPTAAATTTSTGRVFGVSRVHCRDSNVGSGVDMIGSNRDFLDEEWFMTCLFDFSLIAGANAIPAGLRCIQPTPGFSATLVDTINVTSDYTRNNGTVVYSEGAGNWSCVDFDAAGAEYLVVECLPAANVGVWAAMKDL